MPADIRALAQEAVELAGKAEAEGWDSFWDKLLSARESTARVTVHASRHYATLARALIEALDERDEARGSNILNRNSVRRLSADRDKLLAALPHAVGSCGCEVGVTGERGRFTLSGCEEHEAAIEWLKGRMG